MSRPHWRLLARRHFLLHSTALAMAAKASAETSQRGELVQWPGLSLIDGSRIEAEQLRGRPAVVVFWSLDCPFCQRHNGHIEKLHRACAAQGLLVLGVLGAGPAERVRAHMAARGWTFPVSLDHTAMALALRARRSVPFTVTLQRDGRVAEAIPGEMFEADVLGFQSLLRT